MSMDAGDDEVEAIEHAVGTVERAVGEDVRKSFPKRLFRRSIAAAQTNYRVEERPNLFRGRRILQRSASSTDQSGVRRYLLLLKIHAFSRILDSGPLAAAIRGGRSMAMQIVMDRTGDSRHLFDPNDAKKRRRRSGGSTS
jgi:hypothetical protein